MTFVHNRGATFALATLDPDLRAALDEFGVLQMLDVDHIYPTVEEAVAGFRSSPQGTVVTDRPAPPKE